MEPEVFERLRTKVLGYLEGRELFVNDGWACADPRHRLQPLGQKRYRLLGRAGQRADGGERLGRLFVAQVIPQRVQFGRAWADSSVSTDCFADLYRILSLFAVVLGIRG